MRGLPLPKAMRRPRTDTAPGRPLRRSAAPQALLWLFVGVTGATNLSLGAALLAANREVPAHATHSGVLQTSNASVVLDLPADVPMGRFHVSEGELVRAGDPLLSFDLSVLRARSQTLQVEIRSQAALRDCLLWSSERTRAGDAPHETDADTAAAVQAALQECRSQTEAASQDLARVALARRVVSDEIALLRRELALAVTATPKAGADRASRARAIIELHRSRNRLESQYAILAIETARVTIKARLDRLSKVRDLTASLGRARQQMAAVEAYIDSPVLNAPRSGKVVQVRALQEGTVLPHATAGFEIVSTESDAGPVRLLLPIDALSRLHPSDRIEVEIALLGDQRLRLGGIVIAGRASVPEAKAFGSSLVTHASELSDDAVPESRGQPGPSSTATVLVALDPPSQVILAGTNELQAMARPGMAAEVSLRRDATALVTVMRDIWRRHAPQI